MGQLPINRMDRYESTPFQPPWGKPLGVVQKGATSSTTTGATSTSRWFWGVKSMDEIIAWGVAQTPGNKVGTLQGTNISLKNGILKMIFRFPRWDMLILRRVNQ